jgi:predicted DNA-binding transcriptional regulator AlpA
MMNFGRRFAGRRFLRYRELVELGIVANRQTLQNLIERGALPAPLRLGGRTMLFDINELADALSAARAAGQGPSQHE